jgi:3-methyladenine DNA glycosylase AlkD
MARSHDDEEFSMSAAAYIRIVLGAIALAFAIELLPVITRGAADERNFVRKAVSWALRNIGKRNLNLNRAAMRTAEKIRQLDSKAARWIAADAIRELESEVVLNRLKG